MNKITITAIIFFILWHADPLLGNDRKISSYTRAAAK
jgi:hypothetical protein